MKPTTDIASPRIDRKLQHQAATQRPGGQFDLDDSERNRCEVWVSQDRSSCERTQPGERTAGKPGWTEPPGTEHHIEFADNERTRCEVWTRVMGYHRPVSAWNPGKQSEHQERRYFLEHRVA